MHEEYKDRLEYILLDHEKRITNLEKEIENMDERLDNIDAKLDLLIRLHKSRNNSEKFIITTLVIILSFIAAMLGLHWIPP